MLHGRGGQVNRVMGGFAGLATQTVREVADQKITHRTRNYRNSIKANLTKADALTVVADTEYATILEKGSKAHRIVPRWAQVLAFEVGGRMVFTRSVNHPGTKPYRILEEGVAKAGNQLNRLAER
jgi:hypothetical protein